MKKAQGSTKSGGDHTHNSNNASLEELYELVVQTSKQNLQSAMDAWQNLMKAESMPAALEVQTQYFNESMARNMDACRQMCELGMNGMKECCEPFARTMKDAFERFKLNPVS